MAGNHSQISPCGAIRTPPSLLPILQGARIKRKPPRKLRPAEASACPYGTHIHFQWQRKLMHCRRLRFSLGDCGRLAHSLDKFVCNILPLNDLILRVGGQPLLRP